MVLWVIVNFVEFSVKNTTFLHVTYFVKLLLWKSGDEKYARNSGA